MESGRQTGVLRQPAAGCERPALKSMGAEADACEEPDGVEQRPALLERERPRLEPGPRRECERQRNIGERGHGRKPGHRTLTDLGSQQQQGRAEQQPVHDRREGREALANDDRARGKWPERQVDRGSFTLDGDFADGARRRKVRHENDLDAEQRDPEAGLLGGVDDAIHLRRQPQERQEPEDPEIKELDREDLAAAAPRPEITAQHGIPDHGYRLTTRSNKIVAR